MLRIGAQIGEDLGPRRPFRIGGRHRHVAEGVDVLRRLGLHVGIGARRLPHAAEIRAALQHRDPVTALAEGLGGGEPADARPDDAHVGLRDHGACLPPCAPRSGAMSMQEMSCQAPPGAILDTSPLSGSRRIETKSSKISRCRRSVFPGRAWCSARSWKHLQYSVQDAQAMGSACLRMSRRVRARHARKPGSQGSGLPVLPGRRICARAILNSADAGLSERGTYTTAQMLTHRALNHLEFSTPGRDLAKIREPNQRSFSTTVGITDAGFGAAAGRGRRGAGGRRGARGRRASRQAAAAGDGAEGFGVELLHDAILWSRRVRATRSRGDDARSLETCLSPSEYCYNQQNLETREDFIVQRLGLLALIVLTYFSSGRRRRLARRDSWWARRGAGPSRLPWAGGPG